jgi:hypothetical protein
VIHGLDSGLDRRARPALDSRPVARGHRYGFDVLEQAGLTSGTVYPALERLEGLGLARSRWEDARMAHEVKRPPRRYSEVTVRTIVLRESLALGMIGLTTGAGLAYAAGRALAAGMDGIAVLEASTFAGVALVLSGR